MRPVETGTAYLLWCLGFLGFCGIHRFYAGKYVSGFIYLLTFGLFFIGQLVDLILIPGMVRQRNRYLRNLYASNSFAVHSSEFAEVKPPFSGTAKKPSEAPKSPMQRLLLAAKENDGQLSPAQAAIYTELEPEEVQSLLREAVRVGYAEVTNDPETGAVRYHFDL